MEMIQIEAKINFETIWGQGVEKIQKKHTFSKN